MNYILMSLIRFFVNISVALVQLLHFDNIIHLPRQLEDVLSSDPSLTERMIIMVSWNDLFTFVTMLVTILAYIDDHRKHKK